jgi:hypothetical protein
MHNEIKDDVAFHHHRLAKSLCRAFQGLAAGNAPLRYLRKVCDVTLMGNLFNWTTPPGLCTRRKKAHLLGSLLWGRCKQTSSIRLIEFTRTRWDPARFFTLDGCGDSHSLRLSSPPPTLSSHPLLLNPGNNTNIYTKYRSERFI